MTVNHGRLTTFDECVKAYLDFDVNLDFEQHLPYEGSVPYQGNSIYNYRLLLVRENDEKEYDIEFDRYVSYLASKVWQIIYHTIEGDWFVCYAEFGIVNTTVQNNVIHEINFEAVNAKEERYEITSLT